MTIETFLLPLLLLEIAEVEPLSEPIFDADAPITAPLGAAAAAAAAAADDDDDDNKDDTAVSACQDAAMDFGHCVIVAEP